MFLHEAHWFLKSLRQHNLLNNQVCQRYTYIEEWHFKAYGTSLSRWKRTDGGTFRLYTPSERKSASVEYSWAYSWQHKVSTGMSEGQVTALSVLTSLRILLDSSSPEISVREPKLCEPPCYARGQCSFDPGRWGAAGSQRPIKSIPPGQDWGQRFCLCMCVHGSVSISGPTHWGQWLIINHSQMAHKLFCFCLLASNLVSRLFAQ